MDTFAGFFLVTQIFDLFGDPVPEGRGRRGRPRHVATLENRNRVNMMLAMGWGNQRIADTLLISLPTLRQYYSSELKRREVARDRLDMRRAELLWRQVEAGNVGAMKEFDRFLEKSDRMTFETQLGATPETAAPKVRLGKKESDAQRAMEADADLMAELEREAAHNAHH